MSPPGKSACDAQAQLLPFQTATQAIAIYVRSCSGRSPSLLLAHLSLSFPIFSILVVREYWAQFESGSIHHFELRKGGFGVLSAQHGPGLCGHEGVLSRAPGADPTANRVNVVEGLFTECGARMSA